jgi:outer membrane protein TolC
MPYYSIKNGTLSLVFIIEFLANSTIAAVSPPELGLKDILRRAAEVSPQIQASRMRDVASQHRIEIAKAGYYPTVNVEAVDSTGFPGSVGSMGTQGLVASPYREGAAAGIVGNIPIWDFGRTSNSVEAATHDALSQQAGTEYTRYKIYQTGLQMYYECALDRSLKETWQELATGARLVRNVIDGFVKTGQRSVVERYLVESQMQHAETQVAVFGEREKNQIKEIALLTGVSPESFSCERLPPEEKAVAVFQGNPLGNPIITQASEAVIAARARVDQAKADFMPKLVAVADAGVMQDQRFVDPNYYALGVAVILPVFEGFSTVHKVGEANALATSAEKELDARKLEIADLNAKYDKIIESTRTGLRLLKDEFILAEKGFNLAKTRYFSLEGSVVDVRDAFDNLTRTQTNLIATQGEYLQAMGAKSILNGTPF